GNNAKIKCGMRGVRNELKRTLLGTYSEKELMDIALLPYRAMLGCHNAVFSKDSRRSAVSLGVAGLYGWVGHGILDHISDRDTDASKLPHGLWFANEAHYTYNECATGTGMKKIINDLYRRMDRACVWERANCIAGNVKNEFKKPLVPPYADFMVIGERSIGHAIGVIMAIDAVTDVSAGQIEILINYFLYYLTARQMNDDAHDWIYDYEKGRINSACSLLIKICQQKSRNVPDMEELKRLFWGKGITKIVEEIEKNIKRAERCAKELSCIMDVEFFENILRPIRGSAQKACLEQSKISQFIGAFKQN
ncbi:MAG: hypothetical protein V1489_00920, partial [Candidatus Liptonbacteria bacterium]